MSSIENPSNGGPYHRNVKLSQIFHACHVYLSAIRKSPKAEQLSAYIDAIDETLQWVLFHFSSKTDVSPECWLLFLLQLPKVYESLRQYVETEGLPLDQHECTDNDTVKPLSLVSHGQVHISLEKMIEQISITPEDAARIETFVYQILANIHVATNNSPLLEKTLVAVEMWSNHLAALALYISPRDTSGYKDSVQVALADIQKILDSKELIKAPPVYGPRKSETFLWEALHPGGDGRGKIYKVRVKDFSWNGEYFACKVIQQTRITGAPCFKRERDALLTISKQHHPNIVNIIDIWTEDESFLTNCYIQMELCRGDLHQFLDSRYNVEMPVPLSESEIWNVFRQIMKGISFIHSQGIIHGNLKPNNVLYSMDKFANLTWKITDFGFSTTGTSAQKPLSFGRKTRIYFSPELLLGSTYDAKSDIWSAGCILYQLSAGIPPFLNDEEVREYAWSRKPAPQVIDAKRPLARVNKMIADMLTSSADKRPDAVNVLKCIPAQSKGGEVSIEISRSDVERVKCDANLGANRFVATMDGQEDNVIVELHSVSSPISAIDCNGLRMHVKLLQSLSESPNSHIPFCLGFIHNTRDEYSLIYRAPTSTYHDDNRYDTLEAVLSNPSHPAYKALTLPIHKARVAADLAWTLYSIHKARYSHRMIGAHNVLIHSPLDPHASLMGFSVTTFQPLESHAELITASLEWRDRLYQHPDCQVEDNFKFLQKYDYYALGVIMLEMGRMQSFGLLSGAWKEELENMNPEKLQWFRIKRAEELKDSVDEVYLDVMLRCLKGEFGQTGPDDVGQCFKVAVCEQLDSLCSS